MTLASTLWKICLPSALLVQFSVAQTLSTPPEKKEEVIELTPFEVDGSQDRGYTATSTLAGTRMNTRLADVAAAVSVYTEEFIQDLGADSIYEVANYSVSTSINHNEDFRGGDTGLNSNLAISGNRDITPINIRGLPATQGLDYFPLYSPQDGYRIGRYEESRGPNAILFGIGSAGGITNATSLRAYMNRDSGSTSYSFGSWDRNRAELKFNKVLIRDKLAFTGAALYQDNGGWREGEFDKDRRVFGTITAKPIERVTLRASFEKGEEELSRIRATPADDLFLPFYDHLLASGVGAVTFTPTGANPTAAMRSVGVTGRLSAANQPRWFYVANEGKVYNLAGSLTTGGYNNSAVVHPNGTPGISGRVIRTYYPDLLGPGESFESEGGIRDGSFHNYTLNADITLTKTLFVNIAHSYQYYEYDNIFGSRQLAIEGEPNKTLGVGALAVPNPYAGQLFVDGEWRADYGRREYNETRATVSYEFDFKDRKLSWLGRHQIAGMVGRAEREFQFNEAFPVLLPTFNSATGSYEGPFAANPGNPNNRVRTREYLDPRTQSLGSLRLPSWREIPGQVTLRAQRGTQIADESHEYGFWRQATTGTSELGGNFVTVENIEQQLVVMQNFFWKDRIVTTLGYREDELEILKLGSAGEDRFGGLIDYNPENADFRKTYVGRTKTAGLVFHALSNISLLANYSSNVDIPFSPRPIWDPSARTGGNYPVTLPPPTEGEGIDLGLAFNFFNQKLVGRLSYYTTDSINQTLGGAEQSRNLLTSLYENFGTLAVANSVANPSGPLTQGQWDQMTNGIHPEADRRTSDLGSKGLELAVTYNATKNWRLTLKGSKVDRVVSNSFTRTAEFFGYRWADDGRLEQSISKIDRGNPDGSDRYVFNPANFNDGLLKEWHTLTENLRSQHPQALGTAFDWSQTIVSGNTVFAQNIYDAIDNINGILERENKRWGLRPYRFNVFSSYDFDEGFLRGTRVGGGYSWQSANIVGETDDGREIKGEEIHNVDLFLRYTLPRKLLRKGRVSVQFNIYNVLDQTDPIPQRLIDDNRPDYMAPGRDYLAMSGFELPNPRNYRFTVNYSF